MSALERRRRRPQPGPMISAPAGGPARPGAESRSVGGEELWWPTGGSAGVVVTEQTALQLPAVLAVVNTIATDVGVFPLRVHQQMPDGSVRDANEHGLHELLSRSPNGEATPVRWRQSWMSHALVYGNGSAEIQRRGDGAPYALHLLDPLTTSLKRAADGLLGYRLANNRTLPASDVLHIAGLGFDGVTGYNMARLLRQTLGLGIAEETYAADFFANGSEPNGTIEIPNRLDNDEAVERLRNRWEGRHQGAGRRHRVAILEEGAKYSPTSTDPDRSQLLDSRKFQLLEMIRGWRLPANKAGDLSHAHLANLEASNLDYLMTALMGWLVVIEQECDLKLFSRKEWLAGYRVKHDVNALLRGDLKSRFESYHTALQDGWMSRNEVRRRENQNPMPVEKGGDAYTVQMQVVALTADGARAPDAAAAPDPAAPDDAARSEARYNPYHGKDGKFTGKHGGGGAGKIVPRKGESGPVADQVDALADLRRDPSSHTDHAVGHVGEIKADLIHFDPERFQYKLSAQGEHGVTDALHGVKHFDPNLSGILQVWKDEADGKAYVVNGHHRLDLARKLGADKVAVRFIGAKDAKEARGVGALTNIAEGRGTSVDAAHFFRDTGHTREALEAKGIPMRERVASEGVALSKLHKPIFDRVLSGEMTPARGAIIGDGLTHAQQASVVKTLDKFGKSKAPSDATLRQTVQHARLAPVHKVTTHDLFGANEEDVSLAFHRGETSAHVMERLSREKRVFGTVSKESNASDLARGGNKINASESGKISKEAARNLDTFNLLQHRSGPVSRLLNEAADRVHRGEKKKAVHDDVYRRLPEAVQQALAGG